MFCSRFHAVFLGTSALASACGTSAPPPERPAPTASTAAKQRPATTVPPLFSTKEFSEPNPSPSPSTTTTAPSTSSLEERLDKLGITDQNFARKDLYSWTTPDQITRVRQTKVLLVATAKTRGAPSPYSLLLTRLSHGTSSTGDVAKLLSEHPGLTKRRYAWPNPFATSVPLGERSYGHVLVHIVLKDESFVAKLDPLEKDPFSFVDLHNNTIAITDAVAHPERIAAVFHVRRKTDGGPRFREYVVCNESMIAQWSIGTPHERAVVNDNAALIHELLQSALVTTLDKTTPLDAPSTWSTHSDKPTLLDAWRRSLAFDSPKYKPSSTTLGAIQASLAAYDTSGDLLEHKPSVDFPNSP